MPSAQARYWILTIPQHAYLPYLPPSVVYVRGQLERGHQTGYLHWQLIAIFPRAVRLAAVTALFGTGIRAEPTRSEAAMEYVWKDDTRVDGTQFELGQLPLKRNSKRDWDSIKELAKANNLDAIPSDVYVRCYGSLKRIAADNLAPVAVEREVFVFWGKSRTGKSRRAWAEAGLDAYPKIPTSKFWDGYRGQQHVVIDEFRGGVDIAHFLRWTDRYPCLIDVKCSTTCLNCLKIWITSNLHPEQWYPGLDDESRAALMNRFKEVIHFE